MSSSRGRPKKSESPATGSPRVEDLPDEQLDQQIEEKVREEIKLKDSDGSGSGSSNGKKGKKGKGEPEADPYFFDFDGLEKIRVCFSSFLFFIVFILDFSF